MCTNFEWCKVNVTTQIVSACHCRCPHWLTVCVCSRTTIISKISWYAYILLHWKCKERTCKRITSHLKSTGLTFKSFPCFRDPIRNCSIIWNPVSFVAYSFLQIILHHFPVSSLRILGHWISGIYEELENMTHILQTRKCQ